MRPRELQIVNVLSERLQEVRRTFQQATQNLRTTVDRFVRELLIQLLLMTIEHCERILEEIGGPEFNNLR